MEYTTIYRTHDSTEISIIKHKFEEWNIDFKVLDEHIHSSAGIGAMGGEGMRIQVKESQKKKAFSVLNEIGFLGNWKENLNIKRENTPLRMWVFLFFAALVLIIVASLIMLFMNP